MVLLLWLACARDSDVRPPPSAGDPTDPPEIPEPERRFDCSGMPQPDPPPLGGRIALTFDDGPNPLTTPRVLQILEDYQVPATFFLLGAAVSDPEAWPLVEEMVANPLFDVGNHSWDHADMAYLSADDVAAEIDDTNALLATFGVAPRWFRFPYGDSTCETHDQVTHRGMIVSGWHVDTVDWCYGESGHCSQEDYWRIPDGFEDDMLGFTLEQAARFDGGVVLMHDIHESTADALEGLIVALLAAGFTFTSLDDAAAFPNLNAGIIPDFPYLGEACDPVADACFQNEYLSWCESTDSDGAAGICTMPCAGTCTDRDGAATTFCMEVAPGAGQCVGQSGPLNGECEALPGTVEVAADRYVGASGVEPASAEVCAPSAW